MGRLVEVRVYGLRTVSDVADYERELRGVFARHPGLLIGCCDTRPPNNAVEVHPPDVAEALVGLLSRGNPRLEKSAILLPRGQATFYLQMDRLVRMAKHPDRRTFHEPAELKAWLSGSLDARERARLDEFLSERP